MELLFQIAQFFGFSYAEMVERNRSRELVDVRKIIVEELRENDFTIEEIATMLQRGTSAITLLIKSTLQKPNASFLDKQNLWKNHQDKFKMKIDFKLNREKVIVINNILSGYDHINFSQMNKTQKNTLSLRMELRYFFIRKTMNMPEKKDFKIKLPYYLATEFYEVVLEYCISCAHESQRNGMDALKNDLHQKLL